MGVCHAPRARAQQPERLGIVAATLIFVALHGAIACTRPDMPRYELPPDDPRCPSHMAFIAEGTARTHPPYRNDHQETLDSRVSAFCMDRNEVTADDYQRCVKSGGCAAPPALDDPTYDRLDRADPPLPCNYGIGTRRYHPMNCLLVAEAKRYCEDRGKRLPTAEEWEYAAVGGSQELTYPWGNEAPQRGKDRACCRITLNRTTSCAVRSFPAEAFGLFDMAGNVSETTTAPCDQNVSAPCALGALPANGGAWSSDETSLRAASNYAARDKRYAINGFRCASVVVNGSP